MKSGYRLVFVGVLGLWGAALHAQTTAGAGTVIVIPAAAETTSFSTEVDVRNPQATSITLDIFFYEANSSGHPGLKPCNQLVLTAGQSLAFTLGTQCTLGAGVSHHGLLILQDSAQYKTNFFFANSRTQTPQGNGFTIEGFPAGNFSAATANVLGLKRSFTGPSYQSNCFVASLGEPVNYQIVLRDGATSSTIGSPITGSLAAFQEMRYLDVFSAAGAPSTTEYTNVRATFSITDSTRPALIGFCTVQENVTFGADFRVAKSTDSSDQRQKRFVCYSSADCATADVGGTQIVPDPSNPLTVQPPKNIHTLLIAEPDFVKCDLVSPHKDDLEIQLRGPVPGNNDVFLAPVFVPTAPYNVNPPYTPGGNNQTGFYIFTGFRNAVSDGSATGTGTVTRWFIDVSFRETSDKSLLPVDYGIICSSGNGVSVPWFRAQPADNF